MEIVTEALLRKVKAAPPEYHVPEGMYVTPLAQEYLRDRGIRLVRDAAPARGDGPAVESGFSQGGKKTFGEAPARRSMSRTPLPEGGPGRYVDAVTGKYYKEKPEHMTHLAGNRLVPKTHPRIAFRGKIDELQARVLLLQSQWAENPDFCRDLGELLALLQAILGAEVKEAPLEMRMLFGMDFDQIREVSHHVRREFGFDHPIPDCTMDRRALELNLLRTQVREAELLAAAAFPEGESLGILLAMNRMSSGVYILFCRVLAGYYGENDRTNLIR